jgi:hypothetical protein
MIFGGCPRWINGSRAHSARATGQRNA